MPLHLLATATVPTAIYLFREGAVDATLAKYAIAGSLLVALAKGVAMAKAGNIGIGKSIGASVVASVLSAATPATIIAGISWRASLFATVSVLVLATVSASLKFCRKLEGTAWDLLTPARFGILSLGLGMMFAVWLALGGGMEPSVSPASFGYLRAFVQFMALLFGSIIAGLWDGALATTIVQPERRNAVLSMAVWTNLALLLAGGAWAMRVGLAWQSAL